MLTKQAFSATLTQKYSWDQELTLGFISKFNISPHVQNQKGTGATSTF
jgi:hypothetical protein